MTDEDYKRRLRIILSADLKDYSCLMGVRHTGCPCTIYRTAANAFRPRAILSITKYE